MKKVLLVLLLSLFSLVSCSESASEDVLQESEDIEIFYPSGTWKLSVINGQNVGDCLSESLITINEIQEVEFNLYDENCNSTFNIGFMELLNNRRDYIISSDDVYRVSYSSSDEVLRLNNGSSSMEWVRF